jgi:hypothetical protein
MRIQMICVPPSNKLQTWDVFIKRLVPGSAYYCLRHNNLPCLYRDEYFSQCKN